MRCDYVEKDGGLIFFVCQILRLRPAAIKIGLTPKLVRDFAQDDRRNQGNHMGLPLQDAEDFCCLFAVAFRFGQCVYDGVFFKCCSQIMSGFVFGGK